MSTFKSSIFHAALLALAVLGAPQSAVAEDVATLSKIKASAAITYGYRESSFGFSYLDGGSKPVGYSIDICNRIVEAIRIGLKMPAIEIKYQAVTSANRVLLVTNGTVDIECGSITNTIERQNQTGRSALDDPQKLSNILG
jgi:ABC-type amino acid transport substrate-binding protein